MNTISKLVTAIIILFSLVSCEHYLKEVARTGSFATAFNNVGTDFVNSVDTKDDGFDDTCPYCMGGWVGTEKCSTCYGSGTRTERCFLCQGSGTSYWSSSKCTNCYGKGRVLR